LRPECVGSCAKFVGSFPDIVGCSLASPLAEKSQSRGGGVRFAVPPTDLISDREDSAAKFVSPSGTRTPLPQRLQRIFWPASSGLVANFRPQDGQANLKTNARTTGASRVSIGAGTTDVFRHPPHVALCPICDHSTWSTCPQARQVTGNVIHAQTFPGVQANAYRNSGGERDKVMTRKRISTLSWIAVQSKSALVMDSVHRNKDRPNRQCLVNSGPWARCVCNWISRRSAESVRADRRAHLTSFIAKSSEMTSTS
jgi:hypothetical protein